MCRDNVWHSLEGDNTQPKAILKSNYFSAVRLTSACLSHIYFHFLTSERQKINLSSPNRQVMTYDAWRLAWQTHSRLNINGWWQFDHVAGERISRRDNRGDTRRWCRWRGGFSHSVNTTQATIVIDRFTSRSLRRRQRKRWWRRSSPSRRSEITRWTN